MQFIEFVISKVVGLCSLQFFKDLGGVTEAIFVGDVENTAIWVENHFIPGVDKVLPLTLPWRALVKPILVNEVRRLTWTRNSSSSVVLTASGGARQGSSVFTT